MPKRRTRYATPTAARPTTTWSTRRPAGTRRTSSTSTRTSGPTPPPDSTGYGVIAQYQRDDPELAHQRRDADRVAPLAHVVLDLRQADGSAEHVTHDRQRAHQPGDRTDLGSRPAGHEQQHQRERGDDQQDEQHGHVGSLLELVREVEHVRHGDAHE